MARGFKVKLNNPDLISWAIETAGFTPREIAGYFKKPEETIARWLSGDDSPTYSELERLANKVKRPVAAFYLPEPPAEPPLPTDFRTLAGARRDRYRPETLFAFRAARVALRNARDLFHELGDTTVFSLPSVDLRSDPESEAEGLRETWGVSVEMQVRCSDERHAFDMWRNRLFDCGVLAMVYSIPLDDARGFSLFDSDLAAIGVSSKDAPAARNFSLMHDACHLCLRQPGVSAEAAPVLGTPASSEAAAERFCDRFAAALLLPRNAAEVRRALEQIATDTSYHFVAGLARKFKISKWVLLRRSLDLAYVTEPQYRAASDAWRRIDSEHVRAADSGGADYVVNCVSHMGKRMAWLVFEALDMNRISLYEASQILSLAPEHFSKAREMALRGADYAR